MKKLLLTAVLALGLGTTTIAAYNHKQCYNNDANCYSSNYVDINNDGICDNYGTNENYIDANNDGICDNYGTNKNYIDTNNDGICDNYSNATSSNHYGMHHGNGAKQRHCW